jgi:hypothetical protein
MMVVKEWKRLSNKMGKEKMTNHKGTVWLMRR